MTTSPFFDDLDVVPQQQLTQAPSQVRQESSSPFFSDIQSQDERQKFLELPFEERARISREVAEQATQETDIALAGGLVPGAEKRIEEARARGTLPEKKYITPIQEAGFKMVGATPAIAGLAAATGTVLPAALPGLGILEAASAGAGYKALESIIGEGKAPTREEVGKEALLFAGGAAAFQAAAKGIRALFGKKPPKVPQPTLAQKAITQGPPGAPSGAPPTSSYETAEAILKNLQAAETAALPVEQQPLKPFQAIKTQFPPRPPSLRGRATHQQSRQLGITVPVVPRHPTTEQAVLGTFRHQIQNSRVAGENVTNLIRNLDDEAYQAVNAAYSRARDLNRNVTSIRPELVQTLQNRIAEIDQIASPSTVQRKLRREMNNLINSLSAKDEAGNIIGYNQMTNQQLIDQVQSWRSLIDYDFAHGDAANIFRPAIRDLENSVTRLVEFEGETEAVQAWNEARQLYRQWSETFNSDYIKPFRDIQNRDYSKNFKKLLDVDDFNVVRPLLEQTEEGRFLLEGTQREIAEKNLSKFFQHPERANPRELNRALNELQSVLTPEQLQNIRESFQRAQYQRHPFRARREEMPRLEKVAEHVAKYLGKKPEDLLRLMNTRSGIRQLRSDLSATPNQYNDLVKQKIRDIVYKGKIEANPTGTELADTMNTAKNRELLVELMGEEAFDDALLAAKELGEKEASSAAMKAKIEKLVNGVRILAQLKKLGFFL